MLCKQCNYYYHTTMDIGHAFMQYMQILQTLDCIILAGQFFLHCIQILVSFIYMINTQNVSIFCPPISQLYHSISNIHWSSKFTTPQKTAHHFYFHKYFSLYLLQNKAISKCFPSSLKVIQKLLILGFLKLSWKILLNNLQL